MSSWLKSQRIFWLLALSLFFILGWLITDKYVLANKQLENYLPENTILTANLNLSAINATSTQRQRLTENALLSELIDYGHKELDKYLASYHLTDWSIDWLQPQAIYFLTKNNQQQNWGILAVAKNTKIKKFLEQLNLPMNGNLYVASDQSNNKLYFALLEKNIFLACSDQALCLDVMDRYQINSSSPIAKLFSIISLKPFLTIKINKQLETPDDKSLAWSIVNQLITPLKNNTFPDINIELNQKSRFLGWQMSNYDMNQLSTDNKIGINDYVANVQFQPDVLIGITEPNNLNDNLKNSDFGNVLKKWLINYYWHDISAQLANKITSPLVIAINKPSSFLIVTKTSELQQITEISEGLLADQSPRTKTIQLPDGTLASELINDGDGVKQETIMLSGYEITRLFNKEDSYYYYLQKDYLIMSNNLDLLKTNLNHDGAFNHTCWQNSIFSDVFYMNLTNNKLEKTLHNITETTVWGYENNKELLLRGCLAID
ncbi:MAG: hypothetical protein COX77_02875 [Candidatus Komeilibacteria bacterium CG_4_10_14_0_2_um_filter_37_10]|uniref:DUF3352 domain-containing protein n=1 Tax=Candidatus Komeilibacteria bacterium CG_4_10_14_0_2_um_filter_37_10 TaxID=1974470 RepID=A0A2M7VEM0_9BACT|nr:MAG: hypothetical protein COX77_02875 [Candidatus Komeilibacteria bacterium CG_4_10_14_0_2_um_filter_37_10]PJA94167.1 MAG: hypothetical protein CO133_00390 [Candidatus Komeilibacteria bacterium CG_4_9_14_3_um_filter_37_5]